MKNTEIYSYLQEKKSTIKGIELGFLFLDTFLDQLKKMELLSNKTNDIRSFHIYNYKTNSFLEIKVNLFFFQNELQFFYRQFMAQHFFRNFSWYEVFCDNISFILKQKFNYDSINAINFIIRLISDFFVLFSRGLNKYDYDEIISFLTKAFVEVGMSFNDSAELSKILIQRLHEENLIFYKTSIIGKKTFYLSDPYMDTVFNLNSMFMAFVYKSTEFDLKYSSNYNLVKLPEVIDNFNKNWTQIDSLIKVKALIKEDFPEFLSSLEDNYKLQIYSEELENIPEHLIPLIKSIFFSKILLNEYCFHVIIMSCFDFFCTKNTLKNVMHNYKNVESCLNL